MSRRECSPEQQANCPLRQHFADRHHLAYPKSAYRSEDEQDWRELPTNKRHVCRYIHDAIHASGYVPEKPSRGEMLRDLAMGWVATSEVEFNDQIACAVEEIIAAEGRKESA